MYWTKKYRNKILQNCDKLGEADSLYTNISIIQGALCNNLVRP